MPVTPRKELFLDDTEIEATEGLTWQFHQPKPYDGNPIIAPEFPWEGSISPAAVLYDPQINKFRMWYQVYHQSQGALSSGALLETPLVTQGYRYGVGYAESDDGIHFTKPVSSRVPYEGCDTNMVVRGYGSPAPAACILDVDEPNPAKRYRLWVWDSADYPGKHSLIGMSLYCSTDGTDWKGFGWRDEWCNDPQPYAWVKMVGEYRYPENIGPNECNGIYLDKTLGKFVNYCRTSNGSVRCIGRMESSDGTHWTPPVMVACPDLKDPLFYQFYNASPYRSGAFVILYVMTYDPADGCTCEVELLASRDGFHFTRVGNRRRWISNGPEGAWNAGMVGARAPVLYDDTLWIYAGGTPQTHDAAETTGTIGLYHLRPDGYVSLDAGSEEGVFTTRKMVWLYDTLRINARCRHGGEIRVEVLPGERGLRFPRRAGGLTMKDCYGDPVGGFTNEHCIPFTGDSTSAEIRFAGSDLSSLTGRYVQLRFTLRNAELFAWEVA